MDELGGLASLLSSPEGLGAVQSVLSLLSSGGEKTAEPAAEEKHSEEDAPAGSQAPAGSSPGGGDSLLGDIPIDKILKLLPLVGELQGPGKDPRAELIRALRPYVGEKRNGSVETALHLLQYIRIAEKLRDVKL